MQTIISKDIAPAANLLAQGEVVAIPTETVYGLAANALNETAVTKIFAAKERPFFDPLIVHIASVEQLGVYAAEIPPIAMQLAQHFMPGPLTLLLKKKDIIPDIVTSGLDTVGLRVPAHPVAQQLLQQLSFPLAAPSANPFGYISPTTAQHVYNQLQGKIPYIVDGGDCNVGVESTIAEVVNGEVIIHRLGGTSIEAIEAVCGKVVLQLNQSSNPSAPGKLATHYAPRKTVLVGDVPQLLATHQGKRIAVISLKETAYNGTAEVFTLSATGNLNEAATQLFKALRYLDESNCDLIVAEVMPDEGLGKAINDRLKRAAAV